MLLSDPRALLMIALMLGVGVYPMVRLLLDRRRPQS